MAASEFDRWARYWNAEPWGPYRDNLHAAMLAVQVLKPHVKDPSKLNVGEFMFKQPEDPADIKRRNGLAFYHLLKSQAVKKGTIQPRHSMRPRK